MSASVVPVMAARTSAGDCDFGFLICVIVQFTLFWFGVMILRMNTGLVVVVSFEHSGVTMICAVALLADLNSR